MDRQWAQTTRVWARYVFFSFILRYLLIHTQYLCINRPTDPPSLQKRVGGPFYDSRTPPSLQVRVGGVFFLYSTYGPTLATNASRWAVSTQEITPIPHPRSKRESVGVFFTLYIHGPTLAANASRWAVFTQEHLVPHPRSKRESVGSYIVLSMQMRPKRTSFGPQNIYQL